MTSYFAVEHSPIKPTRSFDRAARAAEQTADQLHASVSLYENGREILIVHPAVPGDRPSAYAPHHR